MLFCIFFGVVLFTSVLLQTLSFRSPLTFAAFDLNPCYMTSPKPNFLNTKIMKRFAQIVFEDVKMMLNNVRQCHVDIRPLFQFIEEAY